MPADAVAETLYVPRGDLLRSRVVSDPAVVLERALDEELTGYATLVPQDALLLADDARGVLTFAAGVPVLAYNTATDHGGPAALADLATPGPYRVELFELDADDLDAVHEADDLAVPPGMPAAELADAPSLADLTREAARTRSGAPAKHLDESDDGDAVAAFLADDERIDALREQAREEAAARAEEWGLTDQLDE